MAFRYLVLFTTALTFLLLVVGGTVNPTGSSLACPDWPTCYGSFFPEMKNGIEYEHTHRVVATAVGFFTLVFALWGLALPHLPKFVRMGGLVALVLVIFQGILGGITVIYQLPTLVSTSHLAIGMVFFCLLITFGMRLYRSPSPVKQAFLTPALIGAAAIYLQIVLGALVRHTISGKACGVDPFLCLGEVWPVWGPQRLHMAHRIFGIVSFFIATWGSLKTLSQARKQHNALAKRLAVITPSLGVLQVVLGLLTVHTAVAVVPVTLHLAIGALLLGALWGQHLALKSIPVMVPHGIHPSTQKAPATL